MAIQPRCSYAVIGPGMARLTCELGGLTLADIGHMAPDGAWYSCRLPARGDDLDGLRSTWGDRAARLLRITINRSE